MDRRCLALVSKLETFDTITFTKLISPDRNIAPTHRPSFKGLWVLAKEQLPSREAIVMRSSSKLDVQLIVVKPKFAEFFRWLRLTMRNHCAQIFATFMLTQGIYLKIKRRGLESLLEHITERYELLQLELFFITSNSVRRNIPYRRNLVIV